MLPCMVQLCAAKATIGDPVYALIVLLNALHKLGLFNPILCLLHWQHARLAEEGSIDAKMHAWLTFITQILMLH